MMKSRRWRMLAAAATGVVAGAFVFLYWLSKQNIGGEHSNPEEDAFETESPDGDAFPEFAVSSPLMRTRGLNSVTVSLRDADNKPMPDAPYCLKFASGCWTCGSADQLGHTHQVFLEVDERYDVTTYEDAFEAWQELRSALSECTSNDAGRDQR